MVLTAWPLRSAFARAAAVARRDSGAKFEHLTVSRFFFSLLLLDDWEMILTERVLGADSKSAPRCFIIIK